MSDLVESFRPPSSEDDPVAPGIRSRCSRGWLAGSVAWLLLWTLCATFARSDEPFPTGQHGVLLLERNRVVQGRITPQGDTYSVEQSAGTLIVSKEQVRFIGFDLRSVYVHLQDGLPNPSKPDDHVELARWCIGYRMLSEARFEFEAALEIDPSRDDIRRNLNKLDSFLKQPQTTESKPVKSQTPADRMKKLAAGAVLDVESLGGLPREAGAVFTRQIQPILMRNCTASACHGPKSDQDFKLSLIHQSGGPQHTTTSKNLLALMPYIDRESPKSSSLWKLLKTNHGAVGASIFQGQKGEKQLETFQNWLLTLKVESDDEPQTKRSRGGVQQASHTATAKPRYQKGVRPPANSAVVHAKAEEDAPPIPEVLVSRPDGTGRKPARIEDEDETPPEKKPTSAKPGRFPETEPIVSEEPRLIPDDVVEDPFDPNEFNSKQRLKKKFGS